MSAEPRLSTRRLNDMGLGFMGAGTLLAAIELRLFDTLAGGSLTAAEVGRELGMPVERAEKLITACAALELVRSQISNIHADVLEVRSLRTECHHSAVHEDSDEKRRSSH